MTASSSTSSLHDPPSPKLNGEAGSVERSPAGSTARPRLSRQSTIASTPMTLTPASPALSASLKPSRSSPPNMFLRHRSSSLQTSPEGPQALPYSEAKTPSSLTLPDSISAMNNAVSPTASSTAMAEAMAISRSSPGIIRRMSRGATSRLRRRRPSASAARRDESCGPVLMRRRSDSRAGTDGAFDVSDFELDNHDEEVIDDSGYTSNQFDGRNPLGITTGRSSIASASDGEAPIIPSLLQQGTFLTKITKKKRKRLPFRMDFESAKVSWDSTDSSKQLYIDDIKEIRTGEQARNHLEEFQMPPELETRWFTIVYADPDRTKGRNIKTMHLVADDEHIFRLWTTQLETVSRSRIEMMTGLSNSTDKSLKTLWKQNMDRKFNGTGHVAEDEKLDFAGVKKICRNLHINCSEGTLRAHFKDADNDRSGFLSYAQFLQFVRRLQDRKDVADLYKETRGNGNSEMDFAHFSTFLINEQGVDVDADFQGWEKTFQKYAKNYRSKNSQMPTDPLNWTMTLSGFQAFLASPSLNQPLVSSRAPADFDRPLNEYFISSSHNTYLLGRQLAGQSSTEAYINALQKGCRCIEIDCWDGSDGRPVVTHGRTMTSRTQFSDCIAVIAKYAFVSSEYPLIISLEVHCNDDQQTMMVDIMKKYFGDQLIDQPLNLVSNVLPSPEELKRKILIKVKSAEEISEYTSLPEAVQARRQRSASSPFSRPTYVTNGPYVHSPPLSSPPSMSPPERSNTFWSTSRGSITSTTTSPPSSAEESDVPAPPPSEKKPRKKKTSNIIPFLGELGVYARGIRYSDFRSPEANNYNHIYSFGEQTFDKHCNNSDVKAQLERHNMRYLMRVYPQGIVRGGSSNFDPLRYWRRGVQMVALNWQTYDLGMQMNDAMFAAGTDRLGYVLKPEEMRIDLGESPMHYPFKKERMRVKFNVDVISAQQLPRPRGMSADAKFNPYIEFEILCADDKARGVAVGAGGIDASARNGLSGVGLPVRKRTKIIEDNGYDPNFDATMAGQVDTKYPSLIFLRWTVWNSLDGKYSTSNVPLATYTAKLSSLAKGYRHLPLYNTNGDKYLFSSLFVKIRKEVPVPIEEPEPVQAYNPLSPTSPTNEPKSFFRRILNRSPSDRKRQDYVDGVISRTSSIEK